MAVKHLSSAAAGAREDIMHLAMERAPESIARPSRDRLAALLADISKDSAAMNEKMMAAVAMLVEIGAWSAVVKLLVGVGGYQQAEIAQALGVMRSTVARWYNDETAPPQDQIENYARRLLAYMKPTRPFDLSAGSRS